MAEVTVYVVVTHDNRFVAVYGTEGEAQDAAIPGQIVFSEDVTTPLDEERP